MVNISKKSFQITKRKHLRNDSTNRISLNKKTICNEESIFIKSKRFEFDLKNKITCKQNVRLYIRNINVFFLVYTKIYFVPQLSI